MGVSGETGCMYTCGAVLARTGSLVVNMLARVYEL